MSPPPTRKAYPSDLSDQEWQIIEPLLPKPKGFGHPRTTDLRDPSFVTPDGVN
jgi:transposase